MSHDQNNLYKYLKNIIDLLNFYSNILDTHNEVFHMLLIY